MILRESEWYRDVIRSRVKPGSLVLNIGSSTKYVAEVKQPYIKKNVLDELTAKGCIVKNIDIKKSDGVDIVGNINDLQFAHQLRDMKPDVIMCANTLEHIEDRQTFCKGLEFILGDQTILLISVPHTFPYHEDPIDTMYRTDVAGLTREFPSLCLVEGSVLKMKYFSVIAENYSTLGKLWFFIKQVMKCMLLIFVFQWKDAGDVGWSFRTIYETCAVYERRPNI